MTVQVLFFCDRCNREGTRTREHRRAARSGGRRIDDDRAWFDGSAAEAEQAGWLFTPKREHCCPPVAESCSRPEELALVGAGG